MMAIPDPFFDWAFSLYGPEFDQNYGWAVQALPATQGTTSIKGRDKQAKEDREAESFQKKAFAKMKRRGCF